MKHFLNQLWIVIGAFVAAVLVSWLVYMPNADERGIWQAESGGQIITLGRLQAKLYSETGASCTQQLAFPAHLKLVEWAEGATVAVSGDTLLLDVDGALSPLPFKRLDTLPTSCSPANPDAPAAIVFDAFWSAMDTHYAFFDLHGVNWDARRNLAPTNDITDEALYALLSDTLAGIDDGHVQLATPYGYMSPAQPPAWFTPPLDRASLTQIARDAVGTPLTPVDQTGIEYTLLPDGIGYVLIRHMNIDTPFGVRSEPATATAFAQVATALQSAKAIIIDVRYNPGGSDSVAFGIASHFTATPVDAFAKSTRDGAGQTAPFTATLQPYDTTPLTQPVILLTTELTGSAAEILTLAMRELPQITTMGTPTSGGLSDVLGVTLPNGWELGLSNQTYTTLQGDLYEGVGIPVDVPLKIDADALLTGQDPQIRAAFAHARAQ